MKSLRALGLMFGLTVILIGCGGATKADTPTDESQTVEVIDNVYKWFDPTNGDTCYFYNGNISCFDGS